MVSRRRLFQIGSFVLAGGLLALALYGVDFTNLLQAFREAEYWWLIPLVVLILGSNLLRAWRWQILIDALPPSSDSPDESGMSRSRMLEASFSSVMIGYMVNFVAPRMGEVARTANLSARTKHRFSSLFGTVVSERIFDTAVLGLALLSAIAVYFNRLSVLRETFFVPALAQLQSIPVAWIVGTAIALAVAITASVAGIRRAMRREDSTLGQFWTETVEPALVSFNEGLRTLLHSPRRGAILISTVGMWVGYLMMAYLPFRMLHLAAPYGIDLLDAWALMAIGALGIVIPSPGGIGSYHYITQQALVHLYGIPTEEALTYAFLAHGAQFVFYVLAGSTAVLYQGTGLRPLFAFQTEPSSASSSEPRG